ncbi:hypothetical protein BVC80_8905g12 [Macleaya cordata]|uniref:Uncharacterized protein n=1 Tax=Macleaya cordata TaxID=56857 RepID=A0A200RDU8_MACCD|nr:hypothetical protein BVC80_8905g12 [Macleaya cordata]
MASTTTSYHLGTLIHGEVRSSSSSSHVVVGLCTRLPCRARAKHGYLFSSSSSTSAINQGLILHYSFGSSINLIKLQPGKRTTNMEVKAIENLPPGTPLPPSPPPAGGPSGWYNWLLWTLIPMLLPFFKNKWAPLLTIKKEVDTAIQAVECAAEVLEDVAEKVEKIADEVGDNLPEGSKLKEALCAVEHVAEEAVKGADLAEQFIKKAEEAEKKLEDFMDEQAAVDQEKKVVPQKS